MMRQEFPGEFDGDLRRGPVQERQNAHLDAAVIQNSRLAKRPQSPGGWADHAIGDEHAEERPHQSATDHLAENLRRFGNGAHGLDDAQNGGDDPEGGNPVSHGLNGMGRVHFVVRNRFNLLIHQRFYFMGIFIAKRNDSQIIAHESNGMMVGGKFRKLFEQFAFMRMFDVLFERQPALGADQFENHEEDAEKLHVGILAMGLRLDQAFQILDRVLDDVRGVGDYESPDGGADNRQAFVRENVENGGNLAAAPHITPEYGQ